jgi:hypothetical protein
MVTHRLILQGTAAVTHRLILQGTAAVTHQLILQEADMAVTVVTVEDTAVTKTAHYDLLLRERLSVKTRRNCRSAQQVFINAHSDIQGGRCLFLQIARKICLMVAV